MAALGALVKKVWSVRRVLVLLCAPLALVPVLLSLPPKVPGTAGGCPKDRPGEGRGWGHRFWGAGGGHGVGMELACRGVPPPRGCAFGDAG